MREIEYDRTAALRYARRWARGRNPAYYNFENVGGDCTNFASQCLFAGSGVMNFTPVTGWFYRSANDRTAAWTGVEYLYNFLTGNAGAGPFGEEAELSAVRPGDLIQLGAETGDFYHTPVVTGIAGKRILVAAHTFDALDRPLDTYSFARLRCIRILGVRIP